MTCVKYILQIYFHKLKEECPRTCAHCKPQNHKCVDKNRQKSLIRLAFPSIIPPFILRCAEWQGHKHRPFCQSHHFPKGVKFHWCPKTCELCWKRWGFNYDEYFLQWNISKKRTIPSFLYLFYSNIFSSQLIRKPVLFYPIHISLFHFFPSFYFFSVITFVEFKA